MLIHQRKVVFKFSTVTGSGGLMTLSTEKKKQEESRKNRTEGTKFMLEICLDLLIFSTVTLHFSADAS